MIQLKISNIYENSAEFERRVKKAKLPGAQKVVAAIVKGDWEYVLKDIMYRFGGYNDKKVLNYGRNTRLELESFFLTISLDPTKFEETKNSMLDQYFI
jgi:hypothetical protein